MPAASPASLTAHFMRTRIVEASVGVFSKQGRQATVRHILESAKVSRRTFYRYFRNLDEVLQGLYDTACGVLLAAIRAEVEQGQGPLDKAQRAIDAFLTFHTSAKPLVLLLQGEARRSGSPLAARRSAVQAELVALFDTEIFRAQERRLDPLVYYSLLWALESLSLHLLGETPCGEEDVARARRVMFAMVERVLGAGGESTHPIPEATR